MDISSISNQLTQLFVSGTQSTTGATEETEATRPPPPPPGEGGGPMGPMGGLLGDPSELTEEQREEMKAFGDELRDAMRSGDFDAEALAEKAPDFLKEKAEEQGVDLASLLSEEQERFDATRAVVGGRGGANPYATGLEQAENSLQALLGNVTTDEQDQ